MLSNRATPKYYGRFREAVLRGDIPVCETIALQMHRIDEKIRNPGFWYDDQATEGFINFCENELTLTDGRDLTMLDSFKLWAEDLLGWYYFEDRSIFVPDPDHRGGHYETKQIKHRLTNKQFLIVGRGASKTCYLTDVQGYFLTVDQSTTDQITTCPTMRQSEEVTNTLKTAIARAKGPLFKFLTAGTSVRNTRGSKASQVLLYPIKEGGICNAVTNSKIKIYPMSIDKLQGLRCKVATIDEWLSGDISEDVVGAIEQGASKTEGWILVAASSEGTVRNGPGDTLKMELMKILRGEYTDYHTSIFWYKLDSIDEVGHPEMWIKANPNLNQTVSYDTYQREVERAEHAPSTRNEMLAKRFGIPMEGYTYYFTYEETLPHSKRTFWGMPCALGADLSQGDDFCAFTFLFPLNDDYFGIKTRCYITSNTLSKLQEAMRIKYNEFMQEGSLIVFEGTVLDMEYVYEDLDNHIINSDYDVQALGYDPYNAKAFIESWTRDHGPFNVEKVIQGMKTETVPLGELKKLSEDRKLLFDESIVTFAMGNCVVMEDTNGNRKLLKKRYEAKIDPVAAMLDAFVAYKVNKDVFV